MFGILDRNKHYVLGLFRIMTGLLFAAHGIQKILRFPVPDTHVPTYPSLDLPAALLELIGGPLIVLGLFTRPVAFLLCGEMAIAYFIVDAPRDFFPIVNRGDDVIL